MPIKFPDSFLSSLSFDPLSPASSDSESEKDEAARAAKRRRIERVARDYLQGHPPFISTATLLGPFDNGWVNPWRKVHNPRSVSFPHSTQQHTSRPCVIQAEKPSDPQAATLQETPNLFAGTDIYQKSNHVCESQSRRISTNLESRSRASSRQSSKSRSATASDVWSKRDKSRPHLGLDETPKSPSPSPSVRLSSSRVSKRPSERSHRSSPSPCRAGTPTSQVTYHRTINFTAINASAPAARQLIATTHDPTSQNKQATFLHHNHGRSAESDKLRMLHKSSLEESIRASKGPSTAGSPSRAIPTLEPVLCNKNQHQAEIPAPTASNTLDATNNSSLENAAASGRKSEFLQEKKAIVNERQKASITCNTSVPPLSLRESEARRTGSTLPEQDSETIPAAQVVPPIFTPPQLTPFTSADLLQLPFHQSNESAAEDSRPPDNNKENKTSNLQASAPTTQEPGTNNNACPPSLKGAQQRPTNLLRRAASSSSLQKVIKPFYSLTGGLRAIGAKSKPSTVSKNARFHDENTDTNDQASEHEGKQKQTAPGPDRFALTASCPPSPRPQQQINGPSQLPTRAPPGSSLAGEQPSTTHSSGTPLSLAMAMSGLTDLSTQPDGQGLLVLQENNFDLTGAIEDAESFLQSWDIERDRQLLRDNTATANGLKQPTPKV
ncbi:hypothetical protein H112_00334 [Trichophyton rubrum D6]|uniref:Uncharacterized protein n=4 Tax=Trichophyton TaxID=5550 RepID=A0A178F891_TRIRU|nr:uncharacterized protein TERG_08263 [Trichophyton rubrum CBS 118892]EZF27655.1 hypothetical protein H100_00335 [Trichophyton rubrum MR850]EZF46759.1 hypothetical protein H102_00334 [Trichophyton rubrum CBS 100081]EZF57413.1 hypothetical protein H103_00333 [Trichophyton rubrum CBS 288.86]EZF67987.1 hypothetical protein H104_00333 [Trichophyton rubrum CBS 289.86]EZF78610.1 hypothetical protein H105_00329 [Trichophyton soudanense CBS 452.61]EZF89235.1 hypothetical protein H110_00337 [Trichophy